MKKIIITFILLFFSTQLLCATYTHDDFHKDINEIQTDMKKTNERLIKVETKIEHYDSFSKNFKNKDYTLTTIIERMSYGAYALVLIVIVFIVWLCKLIGRSIISLEANYDKKYSDFVDRHTNKLQAIEENADRIMSKTLNAAGGSTQEESPQTNSIDPFSRN